MCLSLEVEALQSRGAQRIQDEFSIPKEMGTDEVIVNSLHPYTKKLPPAAAPFLQDLMQCSCQGHTPPRLFPSDSMAVAPELGQPAWNGTSLTGILCSGDPIGLPLTFSEPQLRLFLLCLPSFPLISQGSCITF